MEPVKNTAAVVALKGSRSYRDDGLNHWVEVVLDNEDSFFVPLDQAPALGTVIERTYSLAAVPLPFAETDGPVSPGQVVSAARHRAEDALSRVDQ